VRTGLFQRECTFAPSRPSQTPLGHTALERYTRGMRSAWGVICVLVACGGSDGESTAPGAGGGGSGGASGGQGGSPGGGGGVGGDGGGTAGMGGSGGCPSFAAGVSQGVLDGDGLVEVSGIAASRAHPGVIWAHNDSGDEARVFALRASDAALIGTYSVTGATATDWEDIAVGPHAGGDAVFIGDIGDNDHERSSVRVYVLPEPAATPEQAYTEAAAPGAIQVTLTYPAGAQNAESLLVDPVSGDLFILTKTNGGVSDVYRKAAPHAVGVFPLELVATLLPRPGDPNVTGADISPDGSRILVRSYDRVFLYPRLASATIADALSAAPCDVPQEDEPQGEAITFAADGLGYFTASENEDGNPNETQPLWFFAQTD
jgi:hypothetical protein